MNKVAWKRKQDNANPQGTKRWMDKEAKTKKKTTSETINCFLFLTSPFPPGRSTPVCRCARWWRGRECVAATPTAPRTPTCPAFASRRLWRTRLASSGSRTRPTPTCCLWVTRLTFSTLVRTGCRGSVFASVFIVVEKFENERKRTLKQKFIRHFEVNLIWMTVKES